MKTYDYVIIKISDKIGTIEFNYSKKLNALSKCFIDDILMALDDLNTPDVRCIILKAATGSNVFSAGHDINELPKTKRDPLGYLDPLRQISRKVQCYPKPIISLIQGSVWGGAFELVMSTDIIIASDKTIFTMTPVNLGIPYNMVGIQNIILDAGLHLMKEMLFTAKPISAEAAFKIGLINHVLPDDQIEEFTYEMAKLITEKAPLAIAVIKEEMRVLSQAQEMNPDEFERIQGLRRMVYDSEDYKEGLAAFYAKRKPNFVGK